MLAIRQAQSAEARWVSQGWPTLVARRTRPDLQGQLYWALSTLSHAADAADVDAMENLSAETSLYLDLLTRVAALNARAQAVTLSLWGELCRAHGAEIWDAVAHHANTMARLLTPPAERSDHAAPSYVPVHERIRGGALPLILSNPDLGARSAPADLLLSMIASALVQGAGHLLDYATGSQPAAVPHRVGWLSGQPSGLTIGSYRPGGSLGDGEVLLRPGPTLRAIGAPPAGPWTVRSAGQVLLRQWLVEGTLVVSGTSVRRSAAQRQALTDTTGVEEALWVIPAGVFAVDQFGASARRVSRRHLRST